MSTDDINNQTGTAGESAGEATTNLILDASLFPKIALPVPARFDPIVCFGIKTVHGECGGVIDDDGDTLKCHRGTSLFYDDHLSALTYDRLVYEIRDFIGNADVHTYFDYDRWYSTFEYVYDEEGREAEDLEGVTDDELRRIVTAGSGYVYVVWSPL